MLRIRAGLHAAPSTYSRRGRARSHFPCRTSSGRAIMNECERSGCTTRYEPAGTSRRAGEPEGKMTDTSHAIDTHADAKPAQAAPVHESQLFALGQGPRLFGEGSYSTGGSPSEGN